MAYQATWSQPLNSSYLPQLHLSTSILNEFSPSNSLVGSTTTTVELDVYNVIREIVPPPPLEMGNIRVMGDPSRVSGARAPHTETSGQELYTRRPLRPSEKTVLEKCMNEISSAKETYQNLEELLVEVLWDKKFGSDNNIKHIVLWSMDKWPNDVLILRKGFDCLVCLNSHNQEFTIPQEWVFRIVEVMKKSEFCMDETIQRNGAKLLKNPKIMEKVEDKLGVVCILLNTLCNIPAVDDLMLFAQNLVMSLEIHERKMLRDCQRFVEMLVEFPFRQNNIITIPLSWSALDVLIMFAECGNNWTMLVKVGGVEKLQKLATRPEMHDRCDAVLKLASSMMEHRQGVPLRHIPVAPHTQLDGLSALQQNEDIRSAATAFPQTNGANLDPTNFSQTFHNGQPKNKVAAGRAVVAPFSRAPACGKLQMHPLGQIPALRRSACLDDLRAKGDEFLSVDAVLTRSVPTPPPILPDALDDVDGQFSDDDDISTEKQANQESYVQSPSKHVLIEEECAKSTTNNNRIIVGPFVVNDNGSKGPGKSPKKMVPGARYQRPIKLVDNQQDANSMPCIFCKEPEVKQISLMKQLKQLQHCLLQPINADLLHCINANLCKQHCITCPPL